MCDFPRCRSKDYEVKLMGKWLCHKCWYKYDHETLIKRLKIKPKEKEKQASLEGL